MNQQFRKPTLPIATQAAEGLPRRRWTVAEIEAMVDAGIIEEDERFELIGGEVVPMSPKGIRHELLKGALNLYWGRRLPDDIVFVPETTFRMSDDTYVEPDFVFYRRADGLAKLSPETALLAVEVADTSLAYDRGRKARIYAMFGVRELWVMNADKLVTHVYRAPGIEGYQELHDLQSDTMVTPDFAPSLAVRLVDLELI